MKKRRLVAGVMIGVLAAGTLSGCTSTAANKDGGAVETTVANSGSESGAADPASYFPLKEPITITIAGVREDGGVPFENCEMFKELEAETNIKIKWLDWPQSVQKEKRNLAFASGDLPDAFYGSWSFDSPDVVKYGAEGSLLSLNPYLNENYMPNFAGIMKAESTMEKELSTPDGQIYALPTMNRNDLPLTNSTLVINTDWLAKVNKEMPTSWDELYDVLLAFKEAGDLNGNGKADEIPLSYLYDEGNSDINCILGSTGVVSGDKNNKLAMKDGVPVFVPSTDEYKEYMTFLNKLYKDGLLDREAFTMDLATYNAKTQTSTPTIGVFATYNVDAANRQLEGYDVTQKGVYDYVAPLKGSAAEPKWYMRVNPMNRNLSFAISSTTKYPEEIARWIDLAYDKETSIENYVGKVGVHLNAEGEGKYSKIKNANGKDFTNDEKSALIPAKMAVAWISAGDFTLTDKVVSPQDKTAADAIYKPYLDTDYVNTYIMTTAEEGDRLAFIKTDLFPYVDQMTAKFVTEGNIDQGWDAYIAQMKALGLDDYVKINTEIHNRASK